ncbi:MAG: signal peptidase II [Pseudomonadota bacterium]
MARTMTLTALITLFLDQVIKYYVLHVVQLESLGSLQVVPGFFNLIMTWNRGVNFGLFAGDSDSTRWILIAVAVLICGFVIYWMRRETNTKALFSAGLLLGGAFGNVIDRGLYGGVADFLNVTCCGLRNPYSFNVADITIFLGAIGLIFFATDHKKT